MFLRSLLVCLFAFSLLLPRAQAQVTEPTVGEMLASNIGDAIDAAQTARLHMIVFNQDIVAARQIYRQCGGTCAQKDQIAAQLDSLLTSKDYYYALMHFIGRGLEGIGADTHFDLSKMILGAADGGMPAYAVITYGLWTQCLEKGQQMGIFLNLPGPGAYQACHEIYLAHQKRRNLWEFYQLPGVQQALSAAGAPAKGAPLFKQQRVILASNELPGGIADQELLNCTYGPIGSSDDAVIQTFDFWFGKIPATRAELLRQMVGKGDPRREYLRIPEMVRTKCPPADLNALAIYMNQTDSKEFLEVQEKQLNEQARLVFEARIRMGNAERIRRENEKINKAIVIFVSREIVTAFRKESGECAKRYPSNGAKIGECRKAARSWRTSAMHELDVSAPYSHRLNNISVQLRSVARDHGLLDACTGVRDTSIRAKVEAMALRGFPENARMITLEKELRANREVMIIDEMGSLAGYEPDTTPVVSGAARIMEDYDFRYAEFFSQIQKIKEQYGNSPSCEEARMAKLKPSIEQEIQRLAEQMDALVFRIFR